jgi:mRNA-degrading endonuclease HigB of HigAB toxin-antitoxin module
VRLVINCVKEVKRAEVSRPTYRHMRGSKRVKKKKVRRWVAYVEYEIHRDFWEWYMGTHADYDDFCTNIMEH